MKTNEFNFSDEHTQQYLSDLDNMHKVVLEAPSEAELLKTSEKLKEANIHFKLWIEQPENFPTCLAVKPYPKEVSKLNIVKISLINIVSFFKEVQKLFKKYKLYKGPEIVKPEQK